MRENPLMFFSTLALMIVLFSLFLLFGAIAAGIYEVTFTKVLLTATAVMTVQWIVVLVLSIIPVVGGILGFILGICAMIYILKIYLNTTWLQAWKVWGLALLAQIVTGLILKLYLGVDLIEFANKLFFVS